MVRFTGYVAELALLVSAGIVAEAAHAKVVFRAAYWLISARLRSSTGLLEGKTYESANNYQIFIIHTLFDKILLDIWWFMRDLQ